MVHDPLRVFNWSVFLQTQIFMLPVMLLFYQENGLDTGDYFLFQGIFSITALLFEIPAGYLGDIFPRRTILMLSYLLFIARLILWLFFGGYWILLAGEILYSASKATYAGVADGYVYDYLKTKNKTGRMLQYYGRLNFFMSIGTALASLVGAAFYNELATLFNARTGFMLLLVIELVFNTVAFLMLFLLPKVPTARRQKMSIGEKYIDLVRITSQTLKDRRLNGYMLYSGIVAGTTMLFVWGFQPLMRETAFPVALFGVIFFINHLCRAGAGFFLHRTVSFFTLKGVAILTYGLFILGFLSAVFVLHMHNKFVTFAALTFICIAIAFQLSFTLGSVGRIHALVPSSVRSTVASVNNLISRGMSGFLLIMFKFLLDKITLQMSFLFYLGCFLLAAFPLWLVVKTPDDSVLQKKVKHMGG